MSDVKVSLFSILERIEKLEKRNESLELELAELKALNAPEKWQELIMYTGHKSAGPIELTWSEIDTEEKQEEYSNSMFYTRTVIGVIRKR